MKITQEQAEWLENDLHELLPICDLDTDWYYIDSIEYMPNDDRYFIFMKSGFDPKMYSEIVCDLHDNGTVNPFGISNADFSPHGFPCNSERVYKFNI
jgi:hypothetical protein